MIYDNYFQVPDEAKCRPCESADLHGFYAKKDWVNQNESFATCLIHVALGQWETEEKTITLTEAEFDAAMVKSMKPYMKLWSSGEYWGNILKKELFK